MKRTAQQEAVIESFRSGTGDLCVTARAGSGKTTTAIDGVFARPAGRSATMCAFNKRIADELALRVHNRGGSNIRAKTLHGLGYGAISKALGNGARLIVNQYREYEIALELLGGPAYEDDAKPIGRLAGLAKETRPDEISWETLRDLAIDFGLADSEDDEDDDTWEIAGRMATTALQVIERSLVIDGEISYSDMLWLPLVKRWSPYKTDFVVVDEAQDMSRSQLRLSAMARRAGGRIVVIGDDRQAVYSFRGAEPGALARVATALNAQRLALTVSFRCATAIIAEARKIVPDIEAASGAEEGVVGHAAETVLMTRARPGDFVLSRTNAPLARICLGLLRAGTRAYIVGSDIGAGLIALVRKLASRVAVADSLTEMLVRLGKWREREIAKAKVHKRERRIEQVEDQAAMLIALSTDADDVAGLIAIIEKIFADDGSPRVACSTVHRAKGLEADRVWVLAETLDAVRGRTPLEELEEANIRYVAITRAKSELIYVR